MSPKKKRKKDDCGIKEKKLQFSLAIAVNALH